MNLEFLPEKILSALDKVNLDNIFEIRLRSLFPVKIKVNSSYCYINEKGLTNSNSGLITVDKDDLMQVVTYVTENSLYAFNDKIKNGFLTTNTGIRIGICGECVFDNNKIITIKDFTSLNIRIPHKIQNCSRRILDHFRKDYIPSSLIVGEPSFGKTTILKDLIENVNDYNKNILVIDERGEFFDIKGENIDKISYSDKLYAFSFAIRSMAPQIVFTDELVSSSDWKCVENASNSGVKIIATLHGNCLKDVINNEFFKKGLFERIFILDNKGLPGVIKEVYNKDLINL
jgi:stage III sporulation protein AA